MAATRVTGLLLAAVAASTLVLASVPTEAHDRGRSGGSNGSSASSSRAREVRRLATLTAAGVPGKAKVDYRVRTRDGATRYDFKVEVERQTPGAVLEVRVNGTLMGTITVGSLGRGKLELTSTRVDDNPHPEDDGALPDGFAGIPARATVTVGAFSGILR